MRTITAPGVEWREIDRSQYSPAMVGTACLVTGFTSKGEPYKPMEITSRSAFTTYFGEPDNEAERYSYAAACEVLNNSGRLYFIRLPYDNASFQKFVQTKYYVTGVKPITSAYNAITEEDSEILSANYISAIGVSTIDLSDLTNFEDGEKPDDGTFVIIDKTCAAYNKVQEDSRKDQKREVVGIIPIVTTAANALYAQHLITLSNEIQDVSAYESICGTYLQTLTADITNAVGETTTLSNDGLSASDMARLMNTTGYFTFISSEQYPKVVSKYSDLTANLSDVISDISTVTDYVDHDLNSLRSTIVTMNDKIKADILSNALTSDDSLSSINYGDKLLRWTINVTVSSNILSTDARYGWHGKNGDDSIPDTMALAANRYFSPIQPAEDGVGFDPEHLKDVGVVVIKAYMDPTEGNKISYDVVEAFCGSLYKDDKDPNTGVTKFLDTIINTQSEYIYFYSNCFNNTTSKKEYLKKTDIMIANPVLGTVMGFYTEMTQEYISISKSIYDGLNKSFDKVSDINERDIDIVCDAGIANIASFLKALFGNKGKYDLAITDDKGDALIKMWKSKTKKATDEPVKTWKAVEQKFDNFCKNIRKDCMHIADGLRTLCIEGQRKIIRDTKPDNTIDTCIIPYLKTVTGLNSSYVAEYIDWFEVADDYTGDFFWCPPSIKAMGCYINTDVNYNYWDAPAGLTRGIIAATDVAFSPTPKQAGAMYEKQLNFSINYPDDGIVLEGQKTTQVKPTAFDRVNVRRLFLRLERMSYKVARYFVYEGNTAYNRQRLVDALDPYFKEAKIGGGIYDYKIICDESINTPEVIDRNELKVKIGIKPTKTIEFIMLEFIAGSTGGSWEEIMK